MGKFSFPRLIVVPLSIHLLVEYISRQQISSLFLFYSFIYGCKSWKCCTIIKPLSFWLLHNGIQEQIAASHEFDGVRKEKERLTAAKKKKKKKKYPLIEPPIKKKKKKKKK